jgi:hypothetical protein
LDCHRNVDTIPRYGGTACLPRVGGHGHRPCWPGPKPPDLGTYRLAKAGGTCVRRRARRHDDRRSVVSNTAETRRSDRSVLRSAGALAFALHGIADPDVVADRRPALLACRPGVRAAVQRSAVRNFADADSGHSRVTGCVQPAGHPTTSAAAGCSRAGSTASCRSSSSAAPPLLRQLRPLPGPSPGCRPAGCPRPACGRRCLVPEQRGAAPAIPPWCGFPGAVDHTSGKPVTTFTQSTALYQANVSLDRDPGRRRHRLRGAVGVDGHAE